MVPDNSVELLGVEEFTVFEFMEYVFDCLIHNQHCNVIYNAYDGYVNSAHTQLHQQGVLHQKRQLVFENAHEGLAGLGATHRYLWHSIKRS